MFLDGWAWILLFWVISSHSGFCCFCWFGREPFLLSLMNGQSTRGLHLWSHICDAIVKLCETSYSRQWGGPFLSCEIDVVWTLFLLGDELPHRVRPIFVLCQTVARNNSPFRPIFRWGLLGDRGERYCSRGINGKIRVRTWCLFVCEYESCFRGMWLRWFLERNMFNVFVLV